MANDYKKFLELGISRCAGEGNDVADICHAGDKEHQTLKSETETAVRHSAVAAGIEIPPHVLHRYVESVSFSPLRAPEKSRKLVFRLFC